MTDDALRALRDAVKAGKRGLGWNTSSVFGDTQAAMDAVDAIDGSHDAAHALHEAVRPGWAWTVRDDGEATVWPPNEIAGEAWCADGITAYVEGEPARALLLADLEAVIAQQGAGKGGE
jgi:hypothetical protein